jgi:hypothetical protein
MIAALLVVGCTSATAGTPIPDPSAARFEQESCKIDEREKHCLSATVTSNDRAVPRAATPQGASTVPKTQELLAERDRRVLACGANADRERKELSASETAAYQDRAQEERDRNSLILMLTTTRPH